MTKLLSVLIIVLSVFSFFENKKNIKLNKLISDKIETEQILLDDLVLMLKTYDVYDEYGAPIKLLRHGRPNDGGYVVPEIAFKNADALLGYGIADDISFEEQFSDKYNKPAFGFDCGIDTIHIKNKKCTFIKECIANDNHLYSGQKSSGKFSTFSDHLKRTNLENKKVFIKMDIEGAEYAAFDGILQYSSAITGIVLELHFESGKQIPLANKLLEKLQKDFYLIHLHGNNGSTHTFATKYSKGDIPKVIELTFIHKSLVSKAVLSKNKKYPLPVDMKNSEGKADYKFEIF